MNGFMAVSYTKLKQILSLVHFFSFQKMQQQMTTMNMGAPQMGGIPQQTVPGSGWGNQASGQTLSNNLWQ